MAQKELKTEIAELQAQKDKLIKDIDELESKLKQVIDISTKGDITLQCGTQTRIEPQFHLKLDPNLRMAGAQIFAFLATNEHGPGNELRIRTPQGWDHTMYIQGVRVVKLWERWSAINLD